MIEFICGCAIGASLGAGSVWAAKCAALSEALHLAERRQRLCNNLNADIDIKDILLAGKSGAIEQLLKDVEMMRIERDLARAAVPHRDRLGRFIGRSPRLPFSDNDTSAVGKAPSGQNLGFLTG